MLPVKSTPVTTESDNTQPCQWISEWLWFPHAKYYLFLATTNLPKYKIIHLQQIQNYLAHAVVKAPKSCHITPVLRYVHWLNITEHIECKLLSLSYNVLTTAKPPYFHIFISFNLLLALLFISCHPCSAINIILAMNRSFRYTSRCL